MAVAVHKDGAGKLYVKKWRRRGYGVIVWTCNDPLEKAYFSSFVPTMTDKCSSQSTARSWGIQ